MDISILILTSKGIEPSGIEPVLSSITIKGVLGGRHAFVAASTVDAIAVEVMTAFALTFNNCPDISSENFHHVYLYCNNILNSPTSPSYLYLNILYSNLE